MEEEMDSQILVNDYLGFDIRGKANIKIKKCH